MKKVIFVKNGHCYDMGTYIVFMVSDNIKR